VIEIQKKSLWGGIHYAIMDNVENYARDYYFFPLVTCVQRESF
jgi:hypothetical protein